MTSIESCWPSRRANEGVEEETICLSSQHSVVSREVRFFFIVVEHEAKCLSCLCLLPEGVFLPKITVHVAFLLVHLLVEVSLA